MIEFYDCSVIQGYRPEKEQDKYYKSGRSKTPWPKSKHNNTPSMAVDVAPYIPGKDLFNNRQCLDFGGFVKGVASILKQEMHITHIVRHGADWDMDMDVNDQDFNDLVHFELISCQDNNSTI